MVRLTAINISYSHSARVAIRNSSFRTDSPHKHTHTHTTATSAVLFRILDERCGPDPYRGGESEHLDRASGQAKEAPPPDPGGSLALVNRISKGGRSSWIIIIIIIITTVQMMIMMMMIIIIIIYSSLYVSLCTRLPVREKNTFMINSESIKAGCSLRQVPPIGHLRQVPVIGTIVKHLSGPVFRRSFHEPGHMFRPPLSLSLSL